MSSILDVNNARTQALKPGANVLDYNNYRTTFNQVKSDNAQPQQGVLDASTGPTGATSSTGGSTPAPSGANLVPNPDTQAINGLYNDSFNYLNQAEGNVRSDYPNVLSELDAQYNTNKSALDTSNKDAMAQFGIQGEQVDKRALEAKAANSRLYSQLNQGYQQRFGGSSSAGGAASEIANVEQQRQQGQIARGQADTHQQIAFEQQKVDHEYQNNSLQLLQSANLAKSNAFRDFQNKILDIAKARVDLGVNKAQANLQAMQDYRNKVYQINLQNDQFQKTLELQRQQSQLAINAYNATYGASQTNTTNSLNTFNNGEGSVDPKTGLRVNANSDTTQPTLSGIMNTQQQPDFNKFPINGFTA